MTRVEIIEKLSEELKILLNVDGFEKSIIRDYMNMCYQAAIETREVKENTSIPVICIDVSTGKQKEYNSIKEASEKTGTHRTTIHHHCSGIFTNSKRNRNLKFRYAN